MDKEQRIKKIADLYINILQRKPDESGLNHYVNSSLSVEQIEDVLYKSPEFATFRHADIWPTLEYMTRMNNGEWPITWVSAKGLPDVLNSKGKNLIGCEIGTHNGWSLVWLLKNCDISLMYVIDPHKEYNDEPYGQNFALTAAKRNWIKNTESFKDKIQLIEKFSVDAVEDIKDDSLDFIFIDGDHSYEAVKLELNSYYSKIKTGGVFAGHDFELFDGVSKAVYEFMEENNIPKDSLKFCETDVWYWIK